MYIIILIITFSGLPKNNDRKLNWLGKKTQISVQMLVVGGVCGSNDL